VRAIITNISCDKVRKEAFKSVVLSLVVALGQFHPHFTRAFFLQKRYFCQKITREKLSEALLNKNARVKC